MPRAVKGRYDYKITVDRSHRKLREFSISRCVCK